MKWLNWHRVATVACSVGAYAAAHWIPATLTIPLGPVGIGVGALVSGALALAAAAGIQQSPAVAKLLDSAVTKTAAK